MPRDVSRLTEALRKETCPARVREDVYQRIFTRKPSRPWLRLTIPATATVGMLIICGLAAWPWPRDGMVPRETRLVVHASPNDAQVAQQATAALELVGHLVAKAGTDSERIISKRAVPPLRNSLEEAKNAIIHIQL